MISGKSRYSLLTLVALLLFVGFGLSLPSVQAALGVKTSSTISSSPRKSLAAAKSRATLSAAAAPLHAAPAMPPATLTVTTNADSGAGSLRDAIASASAGDTITFDVTGTITLTSGELTLNKNLTITGPGAQLLTISGNNASSVFYVNSGVTVTISGLTVTGGNGVGAVFDDAGGGVVNQGTLTMTNCVITGNSTTYGAGLINFFGTMTLSACTVSNNIVSNGSDTGGGIDNTKGTLTVTNSTISGNQANNCDSCGSAIWSSGPTTITDSTITNNAATGNNSAGGIRREYDFLSLGALTVRNSIIAGNTSNTTSPDVIGTFVSSGYNLIGDGTGGTGFTGTGDQVGSTGTPINPLLGPLALNCGTMPIHLPLAGSPAIDHGSAASSTDQRGVARPDDAAGIANATGGDGSDIGAVEVQTAPPHPPTLGQYANTSLTAGGNATVTPDAAPGGASSMSVATSTSFNGTLTVNPTTGAVGITNAGPAGSYTITVTASSNCNSASRTFTLTVGNPSVCAIGGFAAKTDYATHSGSSGVAIGDFNGDGKQDLAVANASSNDVSILLGNGSGSFSAATNFSVGTGPAWVAVGDFNGDGKPDLATANAASDNVSILLGDGNGSFSAATNFNVGTSPRTVTVGDFNGDGKPDLAVSNFGSSNVSILLGDGTGSFGAATNFGVNQAAFFTAIGDFNGDGKQDLATTDVGFGNVRIRLGDGNGGFGAGTDFGVGAFPRFVVIGDLNGDGKQDLAVANLNDNNVSVLLGDANGGFGAATNFSVGTAPQALAIGDFNGDGKLDLVATNFTSNDASILLGDGNGSFGAATNLSLGASPKSVAVGDFNGDGKPDLAVSNSFDNTVSVILTNCAPTISDITDQSTNEDTATSAINFSVGDDQTAAGSLNVTGSSSNTTLVPNANIVFGGSGANRTVTITPAANQNGTATITVTVSDGGLTASDTFLLTVNAVNDPPVITVPGAQSATALANLTISGICVEDVDAGSGSLQVTLSAAHGTLSLSQTTGLGFTSGNGSQNSSMVFTGTLANINAALHNLVYRVVDASTGNDTISLAVNDQGNTGAGGAQSDSKTIAVTLTKATQTINFGALANKTYGDPTFNVSATATSDLSVSFSILSGPATINGNTVTITGAGTVVVRASQAGDDSYGAASDTDQSFTVGKAALTVTANNQSRSYGVANPTFTASYSGFVNTDTASVLSGEPSLTTTANPASAIGSYPITAGTGTLSAANYDFTFVDGTLTVNKAATTAALASSLAPASFGQSITLTATVSSGIHNSTGTRQLSNIGPSSPTGSVQFFDGASLLGTAALSNGSASFSTSSLGASNHTLTAVYMGDGNFEGSTSATITQTVNQAASQVTLTSSANPAFRKQYLTFTATVSGVTGTLAPAHTVNVKGFNGSSALTGTVTFKDGETVLGTATLNSVGRAAFSTSALTTGSHAITAEYSGSANYQAVAASALDLIVSKGLSVTSIASSANPSSLGQPVTLSATVLGAGGTPTGSVEFFAGGVSLGTAQLNGLNASLTISTLSDNLNSLTAVYKGDDQFDVSASSALTQTVVPYCTYTLTVLTQTFDVSGGGGQIKITTRGGCDWTATSNADWITILTSGINHSDGIVYFAVAPLTNSRARTGTITIAGQTVTITQAKPIAAVSAASFAGQEAAPGAIVSLFGTDLSTATDTANTLPVPTTLAGTRLRITDSQGVARLSPLFYVSPTQINLLVPAETALGAATLTVVNDADEVIGAGVIQIVPVSPGLFTANSSGQDVPAAVVFRLAGDGTQTYETISQFDAGQNKYVPTTIDLGPDTDQVYLLLFGTGLRNRTSLVGVTAFIGDQEVEVLYAGAQGGFDGLDQINLSIPRSLIGVGETNLVLTVDGKVVNTVRINIK